MRFLNFIFFIFIDSALIFAISFDCPNSYCGSNSYSRKYPFKLQGQDPQLCSHYINLTCTSDNKTVLNIPFSGDFHVVSVLYYSRSIILRDPQNCLAERLMNLNLSSSPFAAEFYQEYTFYTCPTYKLPYRYDVRVFYCFNISTNVTVASSDVSSAEMLRLYGCREIVTKEIPTGWYNDGYDTFYDPKLKWNVQSCSDCEEFYPQKKDESKDKLSKYVAIIISIPLVTIVVFIFVASYKREVNQRHRADAGTNMGEAALTRQTITEAAMQPRLVNVDDMLAGTDSQDSYFKTMSYSTFLEGNFGSLDGHDQDTCCSICLEEYSPPDMIRCLTSCNHYFHSQCIDHWVQDNSRCPVCRSSLFNVVCVCV